MMTQRAIFVSLSVCGMLALAMLLSAEETKGKVMTKKGMKKTEEYEGDVPVQTKTNVKYKNPTEYLIAKLKTGEKK